MTIPFETARQVLARNSEMSLEEFSEAMWPERGARPGQTITPMGRQSRHSMAMALLRRMAGEGLVTVTTERRGLLTSTAVRLTAAGRAGTE